MTHLLAGIAEARIELLADILGLCKKYVNGLATGDLGPCQQNRFKFECNAHKLGLLMRKLGELKLWPIPESPAALEMSVSRLAGALHGINFRTYYNANSPASHLSCSMAIFTTDLNRLKVKRRLEILNSQRRHLDEQSKK